MTSANLPPADASPPAPATAEVRVRLCWLRLTDLDGPDALPADGAGVIDAVGAGVAAERLGQPVWLMRDGERPRGGDGPSRWALLPSGRAIALPDGVPIDAGACIGSAALAAMHAVLVDGGVIGRRVLVEGVATPVGHYALQFARLSGAAQVLARVTSPVEAGLALDAGAHATLLERDAADTARRVGELTGGAGIDRMIGTDDPALLAADLALLRGDGGDIVVHGRAAAGLPPAGAMRRGLRLHVVDVARLREGDRTRAVCVLQAWLERGLIRHRIAARFPLARIADARALLLRDGACGPVVLAVE